MSTQKRQNTFSSNRNHLSFMVFAAVLLCVSLLPQFALAKRSICLSATQYVGTQSSMPRHLLGSIALTESGRWDKQSKAMVAWPWTVTSGGQGEYFDTKAQAIAKVRELKRKGVTNIDVGCMQINLRYHPDAFVSLSQAFDPQANVRYAAKFLKNLRSQWGNWREAVRRYHSSDTRRGYAYEQRVAKNKTILTEQGFNVAYAQPRQHVSKRIVSRSSRSHSAAVKARREKAKNDAAAWRKRKLAEYLARKAARKGG